jgi:DNA-binding Lrp family transcriptional regulator
VDPLDLDILRETSRGRVMWWGSLDPRISIREVARRLKVDPSTVWNRLRAWQREGFLLGYSVVPNPILFKAGLAGGSVKISDSRGKERFFEEFGLVEGSAFAVDQVGPWVVVMFVFQSQRGLERSAGLTRRLAGVVEMEPCIPFHCPETTAQPSRTDWRILDALHSSPTANLVSCARRIGITPKTFARRYNSLVRGHAVWSIPRLDFTRYKGATVARFLVWLSPRADTQGVIDRLEKTFPSYILLENQSGLPDLGPKAPRLLSLFLQTTSAGEVEDADRVIREVRGVEGVEMYFPRRTYVYDDWFAERLESCIQPG